MKCNFRKKLSGKRRIRIFLWLATAELTIGCKGIVVNVGQKGTAVVPTQNSTGTANTKKATPEAILNSLVDKLDGTKLTGSEKDVEAVVLQTFLTKDFRSVLRSDLRDLRDSIYTYAHQQHSYHTAAFSKLGGLQTQLNQCMPVKSQDEMNSYFQVFDNNESLGTMLEATLMARLSTIGGVKINGTSQSVITTNSLPALYQAFSLSELGIVINGSSSVIKDAGAGSVTMTGGVSWMIIKDPGNLDKGMQPDPYDNPDAAGNYLAAHIAFTYVNYTSGVNAGTKSLTITINVQRAVYNSSNGLLIFPPSTPADSSDPSSADLALSMQRVITAAADTSNLYLVNVIIETGLNLASSNPQYTYQRQLQWQAQSSTLYEFLEWQENNDTPLIDVTLDIANLQACVANLKNSAANALGAGPSSNSASGSSVGTNGNATSSAGAATTGTATFGVGQGQ